MARGPRKPAFGKGPRHGPRHNDKNKGGSKKRLLDMRRQKYFRFDLDDLLEAFKIEANKTTISATIQNKMTTQSLDDALSYVDGIKEDNSLTDEQMKRLRRLMERYSKWR